MVTIMLGNTLGSIRSDYNIRAGKEITNKLVSVTQISIVLLTTCMIFALIEYHLCHCLLKNFLLAHSD